MKLLATTIAALLTAGTAFAATEAKPTATPAATAVPAQKHSGGKRCEAAAEAKNLTGDAKDTFVQECHAKHKKKS
jgi:Spy/CpxP family protein refolding chaperone